MPKSLILPFLTTPSDCVRTPLLKKEGKLFEN
jgi:hypothetical protein